MKDAARMALSARRENEVVLWRRKTPEDSCSDLSRACETGHLVVSDGYSLLHMGPDGESGWKVENPSWTPFRPVALPRGGAAWAPTGRGLTFYGPAGDEQRTWGKGYQMQTTVPAVGPDGTVYVCVRDKRGPRLVALRADREQPLWQTRLPMHGSGPAHPDGRGGVYLRTDDDRVLALDSLGKQRWIQPLPERLNGHLAVTREGDALIGSEKGTVFRLRASDGQVAPFFQAEAAVRAAPLVAPDGRVFVTSFDHHVYALDAQGQELWRHDCGDLVDSTPALLSDGTVLVGSNARKVVALSPQGREVWSQEVPFWVEDAIVTDGRQTAYLAGADEVLALRPGGVAADLAEFSMQPRPPAPGVHEQPEWIIVGSVPVRKRLPRPAGPDRGAPALDRERPPEPAPPQR